MSPKHALRILVLCEDAALCRRAPALLERISRAAPPADDFRFAIWEVDLLADPILLRLAEGADIIAVVARNRLSASAVRTWIQRRLHVSASANVGLTPSQITSAGDNRSGTGTPPFDALHR